MSFIEFLEQEELAESVSLDNATNRYTMTGDWDVVSDFEFTGPKGRPARVLVSQSGKRYMFFSADGIKEIGNKLSDIPRGWKKSKVRSARAPRRSAVDIGELAQVISNEIGYAFPDGDPFDKISAYLKSKGIKQFDMMKWMDKASKINGYKSYTDQANSTWEDNGEQGPF